MNTAVLALAALVVGGGLGVIITALVWTVRGGGDEHDIILPTAPAGAVYIGTHRQLA